MTDESRQASAIDRLVSVGNVIVDIVTELPALPERGGDVLATESYLAPGGGFNLVVAARRQGLATVYAGTLGTGPFGALAATALDREGIERPLNPFPDLDTGFDVAMIDAGGERTFVTAVGAEGQLSAELLDTVEIRSTDALVISGYSLLHPINCAAIIARLDRLDPATPVFYDPGPLAHEIPTDAARAIRVRTDWLSCNDREAALLTGIADVEHAARHLAGGLDRGGVIVRLGPEGCLVIEPSGDLRRIAGFAVTAIDTNGAGDSHLGSFIAGLASGLTVAQAASRANAVGAITVTRRGPATSPTRAETDAFLAARERLATR